MTASPAAVVACRAYAPPAALILPRLPGVPVRQGRVRPRSTSRWGSGSPGKFSFLVLRLSGVAMGDQGRWFKLWVTAPGDPHLGNFSLEDFARWCLFGIYMKVHGTNGIVTLQPPMMALQIIFRVQSAEDVIAVINRFPNCTVTSVTNSPVTLAVEWNNWKKYQGDYSGDRVARWREKRRHRVTAKEEKRGEEKRGSTPASIGSSTNTQNSKRGTPASRAVLSDADFLETLRKNPAYARLDIADQMGRLDAWLTTPRGRGKQKTRGRVVNWLNRALEDLPLAPSGEEPYGFER